MTGRRGRDRSGWVSILQDVRDRMSVVDDALNECINEGLIDSWSFTPPNYMVLMKREDGAGGREITQLEAYIFQKVRQRRGR